MVKLSFTKNYKRYLGPDPDPNVTPPTGTPPPPAPPATKTLTQAEIDAIVQKRLNEEKAKFDREQRTTLERMKQLETDAEAKAALERKLEEMELAGKTQTELAEMARKKEKLALEEALATEKVKAKKWQETYETEKLNRDLMDAASSKDADAFNPFQVVTIMKNGSKLVDKVVDGKVTGEKEVRVKLNTVKEGRALELDLSPPEAIKYMKEDPNYGNLFKSGVVGGLGGTQTKSPAAGQHPFLGMSQEDFNKAYAKGKLPRA